MPPPSPDEDDLIGQTIAGRYWVISQVGAGGMGTAYRAWDERQGIPVVIKIPKKAVLEDPQFAERFQREIRLLQRLVHAHIVPIVDVGQHEAVPFVVMRFFPGGSLSNRRLRDEEGRARPNPPGMLHLWLPAVAEALDFAHSQGVVHRDVKPSNIFFDAFWGAFLGDFGIAKVVEESETFNKEHTLTATHMAGIGTQPYMAPEQFTPKAVIDGRTDQYALAVTVYEILAGVRPFTGAMPYLIVEVVTQPAPRLEQKVAGLPATLVEAVHRGLAKRPEERFGNCRELAHAILADVAELTNERDIARLLCPSCENILKLTTQAAGQKGRCPRCQATMQVAEDLEALWLINEAHWQASSTVESSSGELTSILEVADSDEHGWEQFDPVAESTALSHRTQWWESAHDRLRQLPYLLNECMLYMSAWTPGERAAGISFAIHVASLLSMALLLHEPLPRQSPKFIIGGWVEENEFKEIPNDEFDEARVDAAPNDPADGLRAYSYDNFVVGRRLTFYAPDSRWQNQSQYYGGFSFEVPARDDLIAAKRPAEGVLKPGGFGGRSEAERKMRVAARGGTPESEAAVEAGLKWIAAHQCPDGSWSFDHVKAQQCGGLCSHSGTSDDRVAATAIALLPFLGRGYTHKEGPYKQQLEAGITYLAKGSITQQGDLTKVGRGASMYSQGVAGIVLSESYAMTQDSRLQVPAQLALNFIMDAQDPLRGGWRYAPRQPGDTSASGWQLMALKSGHMANLQINPLVIKKAVDFLDFVQGDDGATYGYMESGDGLTTAAVGLLCRMYLGWKKDHPALQRGVVRLARNGPTPDLYHDYYATQIMHHMEGDIWQAWNTKMRAMLVNSQSKNGHEAGSWFDSVDGGLGPAHGGRLYCTSLATIILEVYYRHAPLYGLPPSDNVFKE